MIKPRFSVKRYMLSILAGMVVVTGLLFLFVPDANAMTYPSILRDDNTTDKTRFDLESTPGTEARDLYLRVYFPTAPAGNVTVNVISIKKGSFGGVAMDKQVCFTVPLSTTCTDMSGTAGTSFTLPEGQWRLDPVYNLYYQDIHAHLNLSSEDTNIEHYQRWIHFQLQLPSGSPGIITDGGAGVVNFADWDSTTTANSPVRAYTLNMATPCSVTTNQTKKVVLGDLDSDSVRDNAGQRVTVVIVDETTGATIATYIGDSSNPDMQLDQHDLNINMTFKPGHKYKLTISGVVPMNVLKITLPYSDANYALSCQRNNYNYNLYPQVTLDSGGNTTSVPSGTLLDLSALMANTGPDGTPSPAAQAEAQDIHIPYTIYQYSFASGQQSIDSTDPNYSSLYSNSVTVNMNNGGQRTFNYAQTSMFYQGLGAQGCDWLTATFGRGGSCSITDYNSDPTALSGPIAFSGIDRNISDNLIESHTTDGKVTVTVQGNVGDQVCYFMAVRRFNITYNHVLNNQVNGTPLGLDDPTRRISVPVCARISKAPLVQISGGDIMVGRALPAPSPSASISVSRSTMGASTYGSWAEYGAFAPGTSNIATGGNLASNATRVTPLPSGNSGQPLSFANNNSIGCSGSGDGCYVSTGASMGTRANLVTNYSSKPTGYTAKGTNQGSRINLSLPPFNSAGKYYVNTTTPLQIAGQLNPGVSIIVVSSALITVDGNVTESGAQYPTIDAIPQLLLLTSGNIEINDSVTNVNAWLYAGNTISTCNAVQVAPAKYTEGTGSSALGAGATYPCDAKSLAINGPVSAAHLQLRRTHGASLEAAQGGLANTSEAINFRADASLWAKNQSLQANTITTVFTQELPPRY